MLHHYTEFTEEDTLRRAEYEVTELLADYAALERSTALQACYNNGEDFYPTEEECVFPRENSRIQKQVAEYHKTLASHPFPTFDY